ncbi:MAG: hypothetical protein ABI142_03060 [Bryocella sp.]
MTRAPRRTVVAVESPAPAWLRDTLTNAPNTGPQHVIDALVASKELAPLWDKVRPGIASAAAGVCAFIGEARELPWYCRSTPREQAAQAKRIAKLARALNSELANFGALAVRGLDELSSLPIAARGRDDSLLARVERMADAFEPYDERFRATRDDAKETYFVQQWLDVIPNTPINRAFVAGLVNALTGADWDAERVRKSLSRKAPALSRKTKAT